MSVIKPILKKILPFALRQWLKRQFYKYQFNYQFKRKDSKHENAIERTKLKEKIRVVFFALHPGIWKVDTLYKKMIDHPYFEPIILVCPIGSGDKGEILKYMNLCENMFVDKGYKVVLAYNKKNNTYLNVKKELKPDIIFYTNPYQGRIHKNYFITNYPDILTCYVPYSSMIVNSEMQFNKPLTNLLWRFFVDNRFSQDMTRRYSKDAGKNVVVSGFPSLDVLLDKSYQPKKVWKNDQKIKIIWAPHHTIEGTESINFATFLQFSDFMVELTKKYQEYIQVAFKPHPLLYVKLCKIWGNDKTEEYYTKWEEMSNTQLETGDYIDLFLTSDAMIFDSCSFLNEYLYTKKPSAFITNDIVQQQLNDYGLDAFNCHQHVRTEEDITNFIESLKNNNPDPLSAEKDSYYKKYISMFEEESASERILSEIINSIYKSRN